MATEITITYETTKLLAAIDRLPDSVLRHLRLAAKVTADNIAREADARVARRTGKTAEGITVEATHNGDGYVIFVKRQQMPNLPGWLERGTRFMAARPFLFVSARLEEAPHNARAREAIQRAIDEEGLGA